MTTITLLCASFNGALVKPILNNSPLLYIDKIILPCPKFDASLANICERKGFVDIEEIKHEIGNRVHKT